MSFENLKAWAHWKRLEIDHSEFPISKTVSKEDSGDPNEILTDIEALIRFRKDAIDIIRSFKINNSCWCDVAIGDPRLTSHQNTCVAARNFLENLK